MDHTKSTFFHIREQLIREGRTFDRQAMKALAYEDLVLCAIGDAGLARCRMHLVREEQKARLQPYINMTAEDLERVWGTIDPWMREDIMFGRSEKAKRPSWHDLSDVQKLHFKIKCLRNHWDDPGQRLHDALMIVVHILGEGGEAFTNHPKLRAIGDGLMKLIEAEGRGILTGGSLRQILKSYRGDLSAFMTPEQKAVCEGAEIRDYSCTQGCFRPID